jgi:hypothetical protein
MLSVQGDPFCVNGVQICRDQADDDFQLCRSDQPVQAHRPAARNLMVLAPDNLMALPDAPSTAGRSKWGPIRVQQLRKQEAKLGT